MSVNVAMTLEGTALAPETISSSLADLIANAQDIPQSITLTTAFANYAPPNANCSRLLIIPTWNGSNDITVAGASSDTGFDTGSLWAFAFVPVKGSDAGFWLKCASGTNSPAAILVWL